MPIRESHNAYAKHVADVLKRAGVRVEANYTDDNMKTKIKHFKQYKDPYILVLGDKEAADGTVSINIRGNKQLNDIPLDHFVAMCRKMNDEHSLELIETAD